MSKNIVEDLPARKHAPVATPVKDSASGKGSVEEGSEKKIRQAVYDIRYRARREDIDLKAAFSQYMANSSLNQKEKSIVREKLFGKDGGGVKEQVMLNVDEIASDNLANALFKVFVEPDIQEQELELAYLDQLNEEDAKKFKVRVTDTNGKSYVRYANRDKITQLRQNSNIKSVEMTGYGEPYEGSRKKAKKDYDGDGKVESGSKEHAGAVHNAIQKKKGGVPDGKDTRSEAMHKAWEQTFIADGTITTEPKNKKKVTGEDVDNYKSGAIKVAPVEKSADDPSIKAARGGIYASFAHQNMMNTLAEKAACKKKKEKVEEATVNTKDCEKKPEEKEKDMRGYYAKINLVKNKIRSMGVKDPCVIADPDDVNKTWDDKSVKDGIKDKDDDVKEEKTKGYPGGPANMGKGKRYDPKLPSGLTPTEGSKVKQDLEKVTPGKNPDGTRYNPFTKDGTTKKGDKTPTSASAGSGP
tara:strand:- start:46 stop:1452 length:1407 start_codon:yes stop_codon:yes gene_type:complete